MIDPQAHEFVDTKAPADGDLRYRLVAAEDINDLQVVESNAIDTIRIPDRVHRDFFALQFVGKIRIGRPGNYTFYLNSDDGSRLTLNGSTLIENDGLHTAQVMWRSVKLPSGLHDIELQYFEHGGQTALELMWSSDDMPKSQIPSGAFSSLQYRYYQGMWWYLPFNKTVAVSEIVTVKAAAGSVGGGDSR